MRRDYEGMCINELPDDILSYIISFLSSEDAAKARLLSRRWRHLFPYPINLHLNPSTVIGIPNCLDDVIPCKYREILTCHMSKFMDGVDQILKRCAAGFIRLPVIDTIRVSFQLNNESASRIDHWISLALQIKPRKLHLDFSFDDEDLDRYRVDPYHFQLQFLTMAYGKSKRSLRLEHLILKSCFLGISRDCIDHLDFLKKLDLDNIALCQHDLDNMFSGCWNLKWLKIGNCCLPQTLRIVGEGVLPQLETLIVDNSHDGYSIIELNCLRKLHTFEFMGRVRDFTFLNVPLLETVHFRALYGNAFFRNQMLYKFANDLPRLQFLSLFGIPPEEPPMIKFKHLKELAIILLPPRNFIWIIQLVNASPILQKLHLSILHNHGHHDVESYPRQCHFHLKEVRISGFRGALKDIQLAIYLLKNAVVLERMDIDPVARMYRGANEWSTSKVRHDFEKKHIHELLLKERLNSRVEISVL